MKGFIVHSTYRVKDNKAYIQLFGRLENGESFLTISHFRPYFYIKEKDAEKLPKIKTEIIYAQENTKLKTFAEEPVTKLIMDVPKDIPILRKTLEEHKILSFEADIRFVYRFLIDHGIKGSMEIKGDYTKGQYVNRIYEEPVLVNAHYRPELTVVSIDLETSMDSKNIFSIALATKNYSKVLFVSDKKLKNIESFKTEQEALMRFKTLITEIDPDIITGWNLIDFDLKILKQKFDQHKIPFDIGRSEEHATLRLNDSFFKDSTAEIPGRAALDGMSLLKASFILLSDYKLQTAAKEILGDSKAEVFDDLDKGMEIERFYMHEPERLAEYNRKDAELVIKILESKGIINLTIQRSLLTGMELDRVKSSIASLDNLYLREARERNYVCKTSDYADNEERIKGGFVKDSIPGIYDYIDVLDFKSLYPSIIKTFNIDPLTFIQGKTTEKDIITAPNGARFRKTPGILPQLIQHLWEQRDLAKKVNNKEESYAIKITMNSFFGVLANPTCRFYSIDLANAITHFGQFIVKKTAELVEEKGYTVIYGDTDSIFVETKLDTLKQAKEIGAEIALEVSLYWKKYTMESFGVESHLELQFDKTFTRFIMPKIRGTEIGAKKRYAGLIEEAGREKIYFTGLEFVRRDWTELSKKFQMELLDRIFHKKEVSDYIKQFVADLKKGKYDKLLIYKRAIRKELEDYTKITPPHVKAARKIGRLTSNIIAYVMTEDGPEPVQDIKHKLDYGHYIDKQIKPIADSILVFYNRNFEDLLKDTKQTSLFNY